MEASLAMAQELEQLNEVVQRRGGYRNLKLRLLCSENGERLIVVSNRNAAAAYRMEPAWAEKFGHNLDGGLFG